MDQIFRGLHGGELLILPNAWDAGSARLIESRGAKAIATTSAGLAWSNGYPDGDALPVERLVAAVRSIARVIAVPLTALYPLVTVVLAIVIIAERLTPLQWIGVSTAIIAGAMVSYETGEPQKGP